MKPLLKLFLSVLAFLFLMAACTAPQGEAETATTEDEPKERDLGQAGVQDDESAANILQVAIGSADHSTLVAAVQAAQIEHVLVNAGPLTVFAPVNSAFDALPEGTVETLLKPENRSDLATILTRHAAPGSYDLEKLKSESAKGRKLYMATGDYLEIVVEGEDVIVGGAKVIGTVQTSNGIINVVDKVILPE